MKSLEDVQILALEQYGAGPFGSVHLAALGAEVIMIEDPATGGDVGRYVPPFQHERDSLFFETFNRYMMDAYQAMTDWLHDSHPEREGLLQVRLTLVLWDSVPQGGCPRAKEVPRGVQA